MTARRDATIVAATFCLRSFGDGMLALVIPSYLGLLGYGVGEIGVIATVTLLGASAKTILFGRVAVTLRERPLLLVGAVLMTMTGISFLLVQGLWPLLLVAALGTFNPTAGDNGIFAPLEQSQLSHAVPASQRTAAFARYTFVGLMAAACGAFAARLPQDLIDSLGWSPVQAFSVPFVIYAALALINLGLYSRLTATPHKAVVEEQADEPLPRSRLLLLSGLFGLDSFAGGFVAQSMLALWLFERFGMDIATASTIFFWSGLLAAGSVFAAPWLVRRLGHVRTMVATHLPANLLLLLVPFVPSWEWATALLMARAALSHFDIPTRMALIAGLVEPAQRPMAIGTVAVYRGLAVSISPAMAGGLLAASTFGWPLIICGGLKVIYDVLLLANFGGRRADDGAAR